MKKKRRKWPIVLVCFLVVGVIVGSQLIQMDRTATAAAPAATATVQSGEIATTVVATGNLQSDESSEIKLPSNLVYKAVYVESGDHVEAGEALALIDAQNLENTIASLRKDIEKIDEQLASAVEDDESSIIRTYVDGRVKKVYLDEGDSVLDTMSEHGALMILSLDGKMAVDFETDAELSVDDKVTVLLEDGSKKDGKVKRIGGGRCTVTLSDNGPALGEKVTVQQDGETLGEGSLYINQPLEIVGYTGTVQTLHVSENDKVSADKKLITLDDAPYSSDYQELMLSRADMVEDLHTYLSLSQSLTIEAPCTGTIGEVSIAAKNEIIKTGSDSIATGNSSAGGAQTRLTFNSSAYGAQAMRLSADSGASEELAVPEDIPDEAEENPEPTEAPEETGEPAEETPEPATDIAKINDLQITAPVSGEKPQSEIADTAEYSGIIRWEPADSVFAAGTSYTAHVTLQAKSGYAFAKDLAINIEGAQVSEISVTRPEEGNTVSFTATYPATESSQPSTEMPGQDGSGQTPNMSGYGSYSGSGASGYSGSADASGAAQSSASTESVSTNTAEDIIAITISADDWTILPVSIDELDILSIHEGQEATIVFDALPDEAFTGTLTSIADEATASGGVAKYDVEITIRRDASMRGGMNASATILIDQKADILLLPMDALTERGGKSYAYTGQDPETGELGGLAEVETGISDGVNVEIISGLSEGDTVYYTVTAPPSAETTTGLGMGSGNPMRNGGIE